MERYGEEEVSEGEPHEEVGVSRGRRCGSKESCLICTTSSTSSSSSFNCRYYGKNEDEKERKV